MVWLCAEFYQCLIVQSWNSSHPSLSKLALYLLHSSGCRVDCMHGCVHLFAVVGLYQV